MINQCQARGCARYINARMVFCWWHWETLPTEAKNKVNLAFNEGKFRNSRPTVEYHIAVQEAVGLIAQSEALAREIDPPS